MFYDLKSLLDLEMLCCGYSKEKNPLSLLVEYFMGCFGRLFIPPWPFPMCRRILTPLQQTTFKNIVPKGEIAPFPFATLLSTLFLAHMSHSVKVSFCDRPSSIVRCLSTISCEHDKAFIYYPMLYNWPYEHDKNFIYYPIFTKPYSVARYSES